MKNIGLLFVIILSIFELWLGFTFLIGDVLIFHSFVFSACVLGGIYLIASNCYEDYQRRKSKGYSTNFWYIFFYS